MREMRRQGLDTGEIAAALGLTRSTVEVLLKPPSLSRRRR
jgi:DNA-binding CsgD family transcriptional regulator